MTLSSEDFSQYIKLFVQPFPSYAVKYKNGWITKSKPLNDKVVKAHLDKKYTVGTLARWYPEFAILDFDSCPINKIETVRDELGLTENNSMLLESESENSFHLLFRPEYNDKPPTQRLLQDAFLPFAHAHNIEIYPQEKRVIRLPFGKYSNPIDFVYMGLEKWEEKLYWFQKLDPFDLFILPNHQLNLDLIIEHKKSNSFPSLGTEDVHYLLENGLQHPSSRHDSQFKILYWLWRNNADKAVAINTVWNWIHKKHNGMSKDILRNYRLVKSEIERQATHIWEKYDLLKVYPDSTHNSHKGFITKPDIREILKYSHGNIPCSKFLFELVKFMYSRRFRTFVPIHSDKLIQWSSNETYLRNLGKLEAQGLIKRGRAYLVDAFSKSLKLNWNYRSDNDAILYDGRSIDSLEATFKLVFDPREARELLISSGTARTTVIETLRRIY